METDASRLLFKGSLLLEKFPGKGGWTYAKIPVTLPPRSSVPFGWISVSGQIDHLEFNYAKLMPTGDGHLFLPVKAAWRKQLCKEAGQMVQITIYAIQTEDVIPDFLEKLFELFPGTLDRFHALDQSYRLNWLEKLHAAASRGEQELECVMRDLLAFLNGDKC